LSRYSRCSRQSRESRQLGYRIAFVSMLFAARKYMVS
jgi:hypothetical protein